MKTLIIRFIRFAFRIDEICDRLESIDSRLAKLEGCVTKNPHNYGSRTYLTTGHWNT